MKVSILNLVPLRQGGDYAQAVADMKRLAQKAEQFGYERYWIAEHHNTKTFASSATQLLIQECLAATEHIRVGSGGVMLPNHSPYLVAEQYGTLDTLYPNRLDLGLGRAPGTDLATARALRRQEIGNEQFFEEDIKELRSYFEGTASVHAYPAEGRDVPFYVLGSSTDSAYLAAKLGLPYAFAAHFAPAMMEEAISIYRLRFQPSKYLQTPYVILGANVVMADSQAEAERLATTQLQAFVGIVTGQHDGLRPPLENEEAVWDNLKASKGVPHFGPVAFEGDKFIKHERTVVEHMSRVSLIGDKETVAEQLRNLKRQLPIDEIMAVTYVYDEAAQHRSFELLAELVKEEHYNMTTTFIWDLDGTLVDSYPAILEALELTYQHFGLTDWNRERVSAYILETSVGQLLAEQAAACGIAETDLKTFFSQEQTKRDGDVKLMAGAHQVLDWAKNRGIQQFVYTHKGPSAKTLLQELGIASYFTEILTSASGFKRKPAPEAMGYLQQTYALNVEDCYYIGDRPLDVTFAENAGIQSINLTQATSQSNQRIATLAELPMLFET